MRIVMTSLAVLALMACSKPAETTADANTSDANAMADANAVATPAAFQLNETSWEFTNQDGKAIQQSIDASGNYVQSSGAEHVDHGTSAMIDGKACFTSAMTKEGQVCWTTAETAVGATLDSTSDKGEKLAVKRVAYVAVPPMK